MVVNDLDDFRRLQPLDGLGTLAMVNEHDATALAAQEIGACGETDDTVIIVHYDEARPFRFDQEFAAPPRSARPR